MLWLVMIGIAGLGALAALLMKSLPLHTQIDERWGMEEMSRSRVSSVLEDSLCPSGAVLNVNLVSV